MTMTISILLKCSGCVLVTSLAHSGPEPAPADYWIQFSKLMIDITYLYCRLSLYEEIFQSVDALLESVHGDLAAPAVGEGLSIKSKLKGSLLVKNVDLCELRHVLVQLVPADTESLGLGLSVSQSLSDLVILLQRDIQSSVEQFY